MWNEYSYPINEREVGDESCPYCHKDRVLVGSISLIDTQFDLDKEFSLTYERGSETYHKESTYWATWLCPICGGEYRYPINVREVGDDACLFCRGTKVLPGINSFEHNHPDLMEKCDRINNYLLYES